METEKKVKMDWVNLPPGVETESLWSCLHDAVLRSVRSDTMDRSVILEFDVPHLRKHAALPADTVFRFELVGVTAVRATTFVHWPGPKLETAGRSHEEQNRLIREYGAKGRTESVGWQQFEASLTELDFDVLQASLVSREEEVALRIGGILDNESFYDLFVHADCLEVTRSDGVEFGLDQFQAIGKAYWDAFASRKR